MDSYGPFFSLSSIMLSTAASPTPFNPPKSKPYLAFIVYCKPFFDSLTSGPSTFYPMRLHSSMKKVIFSMLPALFRTAAIYSAGIMRFQICCLISHIGITGRMRFIKAYCANASQSVQIFSSLSAGMILFS